MRIHYMFPLVLFFKYKKVLDQRLYFEHFYFHFKLKV